jgi:hypothetical protein
MQKTYTNLSTLVHQNENIRRYMDQVLMFGYMVLFVTALPAAPLLGFVSNVIQVRLCMRRPSKTSA